MQAVVDFPPDALQLPLPLQHGLPLPGELFLNTLHIPVPEKIGDLLQRHIQCPEVADGVEDLKLPDAVGAVAGIWVHPLRRQQAQRLIVPQRADAEVKELGHIADGKKCSMGYSRPRTGRLCG